MPGRIAITLAPAALDRPANAVTDAMNIAVPWLWWPLEVPARDAPLPGAAHVLYAVHAVLLWQVARRPPVAASVFVAAVGWVVFTAAWDRRAEGQPRW